MALKIGPESIAQLRGLFVERDHLNGRVAGHLRSERSLAISHQNAPQFEHCSKHARRKAIRALQATSTLTRVDLVFGAGLLCAAAVASPVAEWRTRKTLAMLVG